MRLGTTNYFAKLGHDGNLYFAKGSSKYEIVSDFTQSRVIRITLRVCKSKNYTDEQKNTIVARNLSTIGFDTSDIAINNNAQASQASAPAIDTAKIESMMQRMIDFFSEFSFEPNYRFCNTFACMCNESKAAAKKYVNCYFELTDNQYIAQINDKMNSIEFGQIISDFASIVPMKKVNKRFRLFYGSAGTGKTKTLMKECNGNSLVCHSAMLPSDLMEDFRFVDGKAEFTPSALQIAMTEGKPIGLDEINLLPFESLRFLQSILDGKEQIVYKGNVIKIADGFKVIGTMNLVVNNAVYALPEPLVDRAEMLEKYKLTAADLVHAIV